VPQLLLQAYIQEPIATQNGIDMAENVTQVVKNHPFITIGGLAIAGLALYLIYKNNAGTGPGSSGSVSNQGQYYIAYVDEQPGTVNNIVNNNPPGITPPPRQGGNVITARARNSQPITAAWDTKFKGIPVRSSPGAITNFTRLIPFGQQLTITGQPVTSTGNISKSSGSDLWYPISGGGWVSQFDIGGITSVPSSSPSQGITPGPVSGTLQPWNTQQLTNFAGR